MKATASATGTTSTTGLTGLTFPDPGNQAALQVQPSVLRAFLPHGLVLGAERFGLRLHLLHHGTTNLNNGILLCSSRRHWVHHDRWDI
jgi:hypothetical protein